MATMSLGVFSSFLGGETASLAKSSSLSSSSLWLGVRSLPTSQANLRAVTSATASKPSTATQKREPRGIMKPGRVSPEMQAFLGGVSEIPRTQVLKQIWAYIKQHNLQILLKSRGSYLAEEMADLCSCESKDTDWRKLVLTCVECKMGGVTEDPQNRKIIVCDEKLKNIFGGKERVGFLEIAGLINPHFVKNDLISIKGESWVNYRGRA
ncbi:unnamed protein product [Camellia sinensis]